MTDFILDNSVAMRWLLKSNKPSDQRYAEDTLRSFLHADAFVPNLWHLEVVNVLLGAEKRCEISAGLADGFISQLDRLPINIDNLTANQSFTRTMSLARAYGLSSYDAAYLELATRECLPLATLDKGLIKAAGKAGVNIYLR